MANLKPFNLLTAQPEEVYAVLGKFLAVLISTHWNTFDMGVVHVNRNQRKYDLVGHVKRCYPHFPHPVQDWDLTFEPMAVSKFINGPVHPWEAQISSDHRAAVNLQRDAVMRRLEVVYDVYVENKWELARPDTLARLRARVFDPLESQRGGMRFDLPGSYDPKNYSPFADTLLKIMISQDSREHKSFHQETPTDLYYEGHITIEPVFGDRLRQAQELAKPFGFRVADLLMQKDRKETPERSSKDTFMTGHDRWLENLGLRIKTLVQVLQDNDFQVWRYKAENTVYDSRSFDTLRLLKRAI